MLSVSFVLFEQMMVLNATGTNVVSSIFGPVLKFPFWGTQPNWEISYNYVFIFVLWSDFSGGALRQARCPKGLNHALHITERKV